MEIATQLKRLIKCGLKKSILNIKTQFNNKNWKKDMRLFFTFFLFLLASFSIL